MIVPFVDRIVYVSSAVQPAPYPLKMFIVAFAILRGAHNLGRHHGRVIAELRAQQAACAIRAARNTEKNTLGSALAQYWHRPAETRALFSSMLLALGALDLRAIILMCEAQPCALASSKAF